MELVKLKTSKDEADEKIVKALENLLRDAKEGKVHRLIVIGVNEVGGLSYHIKHRAVHTDIIGSLGCVLQYLQSEWNK